MSWGQEAALESANRAAREIDRLERRAATHRWWTTTHKTSSITQQALTESTFLGYIRCQVNQTPSLLPKVSTAA